MCIIPHQESKGGGYPELEPLKSRSAQPPSQSASGIRRGSWGLLAAWLLLRHTAIQTSYGNSSWAKALPSACTVATGTG